VAFQSCMGVELLASVIASDAAFPAAIASSGVALAASAAAIACCARWAAIAASCASICSIVALLVVASVVAYRRLISFSAFLSNRICSSYSCRGASSDMLGA